MQPSYSARRQSKFLFHEGHEKGEWLPSLAVSSVLRIEPNLSWLPGLGFCIVFRIGSNLSWLPGLQFHGALTSWSKNVSKYNSETTQQLRRVCRPSYWSDEIRFCDRRQLTLGVTEVGPTSYFVEPFRFCFTSDLCESRFVTDLNKLLCVISNCSTDFD